MFGLVHNHSLVLQERRDAGGGVTAFEFVPKKGEMRSKPGQHGIVAVSTTLRKPFSLASAPEEERVLIGTSLRSGSVFKQRLAALREGDAISLRGPIYTYTQRFMIDDGEARAVLLAQGVGITPIRSILAHLSLTRRTVETALIHVAAEGHPFRQETEQWAGRSAYLARSNDFRKEVAAAARDDDSQHFYVAGAPDFVSTTAALLKDHGVGSHRVHKDSYLFYKPSRNLAAPVAA